MDNKNNIGIIIALILVAFAIVFSNSVVKLTYPTNLPIENNGGISVNVQDQTTRPFDIRMNEILLTGFTLSIPPTIDSYDLTLTDVTGLSAGDEISFLEQNGMPQILFGEILSISSNTITLDSPVPHNYTPSTTTSFTYNSDMSVDGSTTTRVFGLTNFFNESVDITRIIFHCTDNVEMHDGLFCGNAELPRGIVFRKKTLSGNYINYWNVKNNGKWSELAYDTSYSDKGKPPDDTYGFNVRLTYGGQSKHGVVIRLEPLESIELLVQDNLNSITTMNLMVEGHFTQD